MTLNVAIQMDPMESINIEADSTFVLALEAQKRGHGLYHYLARNLSFLDGRVTARARPLTVRREKGRHFDLGAEASADPVHEGSCARQILESLKRRGQGSRPCRCYVERFRSGWGLA